MPSGRSACRRAPTRAAAAAVLLGEKLIVAKQEVHFEIHLRPESASTLATWLSRTTNPPFNSVFAKRQGTVGSFDDSAVVKNKESLFVTIRCT